MLNGKIHMIDKWVGVNLVGMYSYCNDWYFYQVKNCNNSNQLLKLFVLFIYLFINHHKI